MTRAERIDCATALADESAVRKLTDRIRGGAVFVYPTDTIYGVGGRADSDAVRERILAAKGRASDNPLIVVAADRKVFEVLNVRFPGPAERLASSCWPGRLTLVLPREGGGDLAIRVSDHPFLLALSRHGAPPLFSTSANISGYSYDPAPDRIYELFAQTTDFMIDDGRLPVSAPSSVVRVTAGGHVELLREGAVSCDELERALGGPIE